MDKGEIDFVVDYFGERKYIQKKIYKGLPL